MKCIPPVSLYTDAGISMALPWSIGLDMLTASSVAEPDLTPGAVETVWASGAHVAGDVRIRPGTHRKYECIADVAAPGSTPPELDALHWSCIGASNKYTMFDVYRNLSTTAKTSLTVSVAPGQRVDSIGIVGAKCSSARIEMFVGAVTYYDQTRGMLLRNTRTATEYCFGMFRNNPNLLAFDLPMIAGATIRVTYSGADIQSGRLLIGRAVDMGRVLDGASNDGLNLSRIERDKNFGTAELLAKRTVQKIDVQLAVKKSQIDALLQLRTDVNAVPCIYSGLDDKTTDGYFKALLNLGIYKQFLMPLERSTRTTISLQTEEI